MSHETNAPQSLSEIAEPKQWALWLLAAILATVLMTTVTLYAVASFTEILPRGDTGAPGNPGLVGYTGETGPEGKRGPTGPTGLTGADGLPGSDGESIKPCTYNKRGYLDLCSDAGDYDD